MDPIIIDGLDFCIIYSLFPNHRKNLIEIIYEMDKFLEKKLNTLYSEQAKKIYEEYDLSEKEDLLNLGIEILFDIKIENYEEEIRNRLEENLSPIIHQNMSIHFR